MADIVVTEFLDPEPIEVLKQHYSVHVDTGLWNKRAELESLAADAVSLIVRNRTRVDAALLDKAPKLKVIGRLGVGVRRRRLAGRQRERACEQGQDDQALAHGASPKLRKANRSPPWWFPRSR